MNTEDKQPKDDFVYFNDEWNGEKPVFINGIEQVNIGNINKPYYIAKPTKELIEQFTNIFKQNNKPDGRRYKK